MSLIERALIKAREGSEQATATTSAAGQPAAPAPVVRESRMPVAAEASHTPFPRVAEEPQLAVTDSLLATAGLLAPPDQIRQVTSEYRHIKRRLLAEIQSGSVSRMILIASGLPGEGKSFSSVNLALSLALEPDYTVLLIDADVIKPNLTRTFGLADRLGLMDAASDPSVDIESLVVTTTIEGLSVLPAGRMNPNATEYFASARMHVLIEQLLRVPNRLLVVDSLPLLLTTEARALAPLAGQVLLVVRAESTPQQAVLESINLLGESANIKLVLNAAVRTTALEYFGYGYGYGYNYNYGAGDKASPNPEKEQA